jgi:hypothetical protein
VSQDVQETREFAVEAAGCRHNQREKGLVVVTEVIRTVCVAMHFRHSHVNEHLRVREGPAETTPEEAVMSSSSSLKATQCVLEQIVVKVVSPVPHGSPVQLTPIRKIHGISSCISMLEHKFYT